MNNPTSVGRFKVLDLLGKGGMGTVYKVHSPSGETLALKTLDQPPDEFLHRFKREFRAASRLKHHNIVSVYELEVDPVPFFTMEYVDGDSLFGYLDVDKNTAMPLESSELRRLFFALGQILKALDYVHARGVVHRDIKPDNILVNREGAIKITDFGLAKIVEAQTSLTQSGHFMGTVTYVAPEQITSSPVDVRTDLYALGVILYKVFTGSNPFPAKDVIAVIHQKMQGYVPVEPREHTPELSERWARITMKLIEHEPSNRYQSVPELFADLRDAWTETPGERLAPEDDQTSFLTSVKGVLTAPRFVGRDKEMEILRKALAAATSGKGNALQLVSLGQAA